MPINKALLVHQLVDGEHPADDHVGLDLHAQLAQGVDLLLHDGLRETELRNAVDKHAAGKMKRLEYRDVVAFLGEVAGAGESGRAGTDDRDLSAVGDGLADR